MSSKKVGHFKNNKGLYGLTTHLSVDTSTTELSISYRYYLLKFNTFLDLNCQNVDNIFDYGEGNLSYPPNLFKPTPSLYDQRNVSFVLCYTKIIR